jgi:nucleoside-diphosphate kinase
MKERTLALIKPDIVGRNLIPEIMVLLTEGFKIVDMVMYKMTIDDAKEFCARDSAEPAFMDIVESMTLGPVVAIVVEGENVIPTLVDRVEKEIQPSYATNDVVDAVYTSTTKEDADKEIKFFFGNF